MTEPQPPDSATGATRTVAPSDADIETEVVELHRFFEAWFRGELPKTEDAFARFGDALADSFAIVSPSGRLAQRDAILSAVFDAHGSWPAANTIRVDAVTVRWRGAEAVLATYEEWQTRDGVTKGRVSTVLMTMTTPPRWLHVHETWLPEAAPE